MDSIGLTMPLLIRTAKALSLRIPWVSASQCSRGCWARSGWSPNPRWHSTPWACSRCASRSSRGSIPVRHGSCLVPCGLVGPSSSRGLYGVACLFSFDAPRVWWWIHRCWSRPSSEWAPTRPALAMRVAASFWLCPQGRHGPRSPSLLLAIHLQRVWRVLSAAPIQPRSASFSISYSVSEGSTRRLEPRARCS